MQYRTSLNYRECRELARLIAAGSDLHFARAVYELPPEWIDDFLCLVDPDEGFDEALVKSLEEAGVEVLP